MLSPTRLAVLDGGDVLLPLLLLPGLPEWRAVAAVCAGGDAMAVVWCRRTPRVFRRGCVPADATDIAETTPLVALCALADDKQQQTGEETV